MEDLAAWLADRAPWLLEKELGVCVVGSQALRKACDRAGVEGPVSADLDLSWAPDVASGRALLESHGAYLKSTEANQRRGTLGMKVGRERIEITSFRQTPGTNAGAILEDRILADLAGRDMTLGALAHWLTEDRILDPFDGLAAWRDGKIIPVGDPSVRIHEHPIRWLRYYRRAHQWNFELDASIRQVDIDPELLKQAPSEAVGAELRAALLQCESPGKFLRDLYECGVLATIAPELAPQFDGRPAGPIAHHPEGSQSNHMILALEWIVARTKDLEERARLATIAAVLCHDLGKGLTPIEKLPSHHGHEQSGLEPLRFFLTRYPVLTDPVGRRLAEHVCELHLQIRNLPKLRSGTRAKLYQRFFRDKNFPTKCFALAIGADSGGRLDREAEGEEVATRVQAYIEWMQARAATVDAAALFEQFGEDKERFKSELHQAYARGLRGVPDETPRPAT